MKVIGITGGVGSGKSEVLRLLEEKFNCGVIRTDDVARDLCEPGEKSYEMIVETFGKEILDSEGPLNQCTHPQVYEWVQNKVREWRTENSYSMSAVEAALMDELKEIGVCENYWYVHVKPEIRRERLRISRGYSDEKMDAIFTSQLPESVFLNGCDVVIDNNSDLENVEKQLNSLCK